MNITWDNFFRLAPWIDTDEQTMYDFVNTGSVFNTQFTGHATDYKNIEVLVYSGNNQIGTNIIQGVPDYSDKLDQIYFILYDLKIIILLFMFVLLVIMFVKLYSRFLHAKKLKG